MNLLIAYRISKKSRYVLVDGLNNMNELIPNLQNLGKRHKEYGVESFHYPIVNPAFFSPSSNIWVKTLAKKHDKLGQKSRG
ncbi:hypothetical protein IT6_01260 [Methylacidiphilum caldifontis]|uniref:hypothetical protein n=1 Tax=Methylacidiphilum caldifontis TaxID=2795386 RepID=UPI001A8CB8AC|nr:hypothetical protein [Methylacidiphilum caldifontis]QSR88961.1 hypothetical protein IT6_01260 [Methylacidiphilum caldifontis]